MNRYKKKPVVIEAVQFKYANNTEDLVFSFEGDEMPKWLKLALDTKVIEPRVRRESGRTELWIKTLEGGHWGSWLDWILQGVKGELYPCKPDIFEATYEEA